MRYLIAAGLVAVALLPAAWADTSRPKLAPFHAIDVAGVAEIQFTEGARQSVTVTASSTVMPRLSLTVARGVLTIRFTHGRTLHTNEAPTVTITAPALDSLVVKGVANGNLARLSGDNFALSIAGAANVTLSGSVVHDTIIVRGAGHVDARRLIAQDLHLTIGGTGAVRAYARHAAHVSISGVGSATIDGKPPVHDVTQGGIATVDFE